MDILPVPSDGDSGFQILDVEILRGTFPGEWSRVWRRVLRVGKSENKDEGLPSAEYLERP